MSSQEDNWDGGERRKSRVNTVKERIWKRIEETTDENMKSILMLMFGSLEYTDAAMHRIEAKIDAIRHDEVTLKRVVLNGHNIKHHDHHDWIEHRINNDKYYTDLISRAMPVIEFVEHRMMNNGVCSWASSQIEKEKELTKDKKTLIMKFLESIMGHLGTALAAVLVAWIMWGPK